MEAHGHIPYTSSAQATPLLSARPSMRDHADWLKATGEVAVLRGRRDRRNASLMALPALLTSIGLLMGSDVVWDGSPEGAMASNWLLVGFIVSLFVIACLWALHRRGVQRIETGERLIRRADLQLRRAQEFSAATPGRGQEQ